MDSEQKLILIVVGMLLIGIAGSGMACHSISVNRDVKAFEHGYCQTALPGLNYTAWVKCP